MASGAWGDHQLGRAVWCESAVPDEVSGALQAGDLDRARLALVREYVQVVRVFAIEVEQGALGEWVDAVALCC
jgi:hypothetical protein